LWDLESETVKYGHEFRVTRTLELLRWRGPAAVLNERLILLSEKMLHEDYDRKCSVERKIAGHDSQGLVAKTSSLAVNRQS
jgi:hypothetical protein